MGNEKSTSTGKARKSGLGRGLGALIPQVDADEVVAATRPLDVFFPESKGGSALPRGGSARSLLQPKQKATGTRHAVKATAVRSTQAQHDVATISDNASTRPPAQAIGTADNGGTVLTQDPPRSTSKGSHTRGTTSDKQDVSRETSAATFGDGTLNQEPTDVKEMRDNAATYAESSASTMLAGTQYAELPIHLIVPNTRQPRVVFDEDELEELVASIHEVGILQPIVVRPISLTGEPSARLRELLEEKPDARFELIMGERRLRSAERAGLNEIPAIIRHTDDNDLLRDALLENLHRAQLNPLEEAAAYQQLMADFGATQEELSKKIARSRPQIANTLRLLKLPPSVQNKVAAQVISAGHARALLSLTETRDMEILADRIVAEGLSVRTTEELVRLGKVKAAAAKVARIRPPSSPLATQVASTLENLYDTRVTVSEGRNKGKIVIEFAGTEDLQRIAALIMASDK
ncbi:ParB/RepB/Spo0J family partition protein [Schaalia suimastitidis]|uniref:ParB/RepB/Spo0J family partition protein n=1 Tax=Schaalia suimastitidis TaxID=121163 RepID=UPI00041F6DD0|nr:ParB/RepB/Spo0J family partition protein [Schaalia suimastitidis]